MIAGAICLVAMVIVNFVCPDSLRKLARETEATTLPDVGTHVHMPAPTPALGLPGGLPALAAPATQTPLLVAPAPVSGETAAPGDPVLLD